MVMADVDVAEDLSALSLNGASTASGKLKENINIVFIGHVGTAFCLMTC